MELNQTLTGLVEELSKLDIDIYLVHSEKYLDEDNLVRCFTTANRIAPNCIKDWAKVSEIASMPLDSMKVEIEKYADEYRIVIYTIVYR